jgi:hypothetical protein
LIPQVRRKFTVFLSHGAASWFWKNIFTANTATNRTTRARREKFDLDAFRRGGQGGASRFGFDSGLSSDERRRVSADLETRKKSLTVENLLTMSSGLDCDDADPKSPGGEDYLIDESGESDYYKYTLSLKMIREPGEKSVYCSIQPNLVGGVLQRPLNNLCLYCFKIYSLNRSKSNGII